MCTLTVQRKWTGHEKISSARLQHHQFSDFNSGSISAKPRIAEKQNLFIIHKKYLPIIYPGQTTLCKLQLSSSTEIKAWLYPESSLSGTRQAFHRHPSLSPTLLLLCILKPRAAHTALLSLASLSLQKHHVLLPLPDWWCYLKLQSDTTQPSTLWISLSTCLESRDKILRISLEMWLADTEATPAAAHPATNTLPGKPNTERHKILQTQV